MTEPMVSRLALDRSPIGRKAKVPSQDWAGVVETFRQQGRHRLLTIRSATGDTIEVAEALCVFEGDPRPPRSTPAEPASVPVEAPVSTPSFGLDLDAIATEIVQLHARGEQIVIFSEEAVALAHSHLENAALARSLQRAALATTSAGWKAK